MTRYLPVLLASLLSVTAQLAAAGEVRRQDPDFTMAAGIGMAWLEANDYLHDPQTGDRFGQMIREGAVPVLTLEARLGLPHDLYISSGLRLGFSGDSQSAIYGWSTLAASFDFDDWTERSLHPDTRLDRYIDFDIALGRRLYPSDAVELDLHGGFKFTHVRWTSRGGSYVMSSQDLRDVSGDLTADTVATYEQRLPGLFVGMGGLWRPGDWILSGHARAGITVGAATSDQYPLSAISMVDSFDAMPFLSVAARLDYRIGGHGSLFVSGRYDRYFRRIGDTSTTYDSQPSGELENSASADFSSFFLQAGFRIGF